MSRTLEMTHKIMSAVKSKNTRPELALRHALWARGLRYRVNVKSLKGKPDVVFTRAKIVVFVTVTSGTDITGQSEAYRR